MSAERESTAVRLVVWLGRQTLDGLIALGQIFLLLSRSARRATRRPWQIRNYIYQVVQVGVDSLGLGVTMAVFAGMVLAFQFGYGLERFGAKLYIGQITVTALFRELGPMLTALIVGARIGAGMAAELGGMVVTQQIDAARALGGDPWQRLVAPRLFATTLALPLLSIVSDIVGAIGGMIIAWAEYEVPPHLFVRGVYDFVTVGDFLTGIIKSAVFGLIIATLSCREGMRAEGGTEGVGQATTKAVVASSLTVLAADFVLTKLLMKL